MIRFRKFLPVAAILIGAAILGMPTQADAAFAVRFSSGAFSLTVVNGSAQDSDGNATRISVNSTDATVLAFEAASGFDISGATASFSQKVKGSILTETQNTITRTGAGGGAISITTGFDGFVLPAGSPLLVNSTVAFTGISTTPVSTYKFTNWADDIPPAQSLITPTGVSATTGTYIFSTQIPPGSVPSLTTPQTSFTRTTSPFQLTSRSEITFGGTDDSLTYTATTTVTATPAPAGAVLALAGMPLLGLGAWVRGRRAQAKA